jgi:hypothetical protein
VGLSISKPGEPALLASSSLPGQKTVALDIGEGWLHEAEKLVQESCSKLGVKVEVSAPIMTTFLTLSRLEQNREMIQI